MGHCETGKTQLFNNLCGTKYQMGFSKGTLTRNIACEDVKFAREDVK
jgi:Fe2+ transport system protein B